MTATAGLIFFEPSTRTRMSFEFACAREGVFPVTLSGESGTSLEKGETAEDTILNIASMEPDVLIIRCGDSVDLAALAARLRRPVINAGWGKKGHPTQALLDAFAIQQRRGPLKGMRLLIVGDVRHSRVATSHFELASHLGYEVGLACPPEFSVSHPGVRFFDDLHEGLAWADVLMSLRVQTERHHNQSDLIAFRNGWRLDAEKLRRLKTDGLILHPGPVNWGVELAEEVALDPRTLILDQVRAGVFIRQAVIRWALGRVV